jgi:Fic-DOC domain mobile mystery protein B
MFNRAWRWAGNYRRTERNLGVAVYRIQPELQQIIDDARYWTNHRTYAHDELAVRFHHRLVYVHPFPNGNGRWSRLAADLLIFREGRARFTWGRINLQTTGDVRQKYVDALHAADDHDLQPLIAFARS